MHPQRRPTHQQADHKAIDSSHRQGQPKAHAEFEEQRHGVGAYAKEGGVAERLLPGVAHRQVQAHGGDDEHQPGGEHVDAVVFGKGRRDHQKQQHQGHQGDMQLFHTLRSSLRPNRPCGLNRITNMKIPSATASL